MYSPLHWHHRSSVSCWQRAHRFSTLIFCRWSDWQGRLFRDRPMREWPALGLAPRQLEQNPLEGAAGYSEWLPPPQSSSLAPLESACRVGRFCRGGPSSGGHLPPRCRRSEVSELECGDTSPCCLPDTARRSRRLHHLVGSVQGMPCTHEVCPIVA